MNKIQEIPGYLGGGTVGNRQQKNVAMDEAIQLLPAMVEKLDRLLGRISGTISKGEEKNPCPPRTSPPLREILDSGPDYIRDYVDKAMAIADEIENALF